MESIEAELIDVEYGGLSTREDKRRLQKHLYEATKEDAEILSLARAVAARKASLLLLTDSLYSRNAAD